MSLRILLADESANIKKAFHLALSYLGADIKTVPSGLDVISVALDFKPQIVFVDVLMTKKSGYDICREIRSTPELKDVPVILMWSNFMEFNLSMAQEAGYTDKLEKPFDVDSLKSIISKHEPQSLDNPVTPFIERPTVSHLQDEFKPRQLKVENLEFSNPTKIESKNRTEVPTIELETESFGEFEEVILVKSPQTRHETQSALADKITKQIKDSVAQNKDIGATINTDKNRFDEHLMREEVRIMAEKICWQVIPDIAERLIKEEIDKLMKSIERQV